MVTSVRFALVFAVACSGASPKPQPDPQPDPTPQPDPVLSDDGHHVRAERVYEGDCMPAGTRGGCHTITLRPDGTYTNFLFDAAISGTYDIQDHVVSMTTSDGGVSEPMTLSEDYSKLGDLPLKP